MLYLYNDDGKYLRSVLESHITYTNATKKAPNFEKLNSENWEVKFNKELDDWEYTDLVEEQKPQEEEENTAQITQPEEPPAQFITDKNLKEYLVKLLEEDEGIRKRLCK